MQIRVATLNADAKLHLIYQSTNFLARFLENKINLDALLTQRMGAEGAHMASSPTFYLSKRDISIYTLYNNSMPGVCARCTARKDIDRGGKECYHHRHDNYCRSEIGNDGLCSANPKKSDRGI